MKPGQEIMKPDFSPGLGAGQEIMKPDYSPGLGAGQEIMKPDFSPYRSRTRNHET